MPYLGPHRKMEQYFDQNTGQLHKKWVDKDGVILKKKKKKEKFTLPLNDAYNVP